MKVFIADDSAAVVERWITMLSEIPQVEIIGQAQDAREAIKAIRQLNPDVVILDIRMPGGNGIDVLKDIKSNKPPPLVIVLTNYPYPQYRKKCMALGRNSFLTNQPNLRRSRRCSKG